MQLNGHTPADRLTGHALRNANLRRRALVRAETAPPLAGTIVKIRAQILGLTRLEFARRSGISRGTLRDLELGIHTPTRRVLQRFVDYCRRCAVDAEQLEQLCRLYAGQGATLEEFIARLELRAGSPRELAHRVGISPTTLWEYRRGNFPLPLDLLRKLCEAVGEEAGPAEALWHQAERARLLARGYPEALAEFWVLCERAGYTEGRLLRLGVSMATVRKLRYLEVPPWPEVAAAAQKLCANSRELAALQERWKRAEQEQHCRDGFGPRLKQLRKRHGITRRELADLFGIGGKKPARIIKYIEEDGFHSAQAYPAGLAAVLAGDEREQERLLRQWRLRRTQFHRRHRPETRLELRLARELYGFEIKDMQPVLGYTGLEYQRIERGVSPLLDTAKERILQAIHAAGRQKVEALLDHRRRREADRAAWQTPATLPEMVALLARREGGLIPLTRFLRQAGVQGMWAGRLRGLSQGRDVPAWPIVEQIGKACGVPDLTQVRLDWEDRYRAALRRQCPSPLGVELRLLIATTAATLREFSPKLGFNYSVLVRDLQRIDRDEPIRWFHVERVLRALDLTPDDPRWKEIHALWYTAAERCKRTRVMNGQPRPAGNGTVARPERG